MGTVSAAPVPVRAPRSIPLLLLLATLVAGPAAAQLEPPSTGGLPALDLSLRVLGRYKRVLVIAAHPDDEDTELLTLLVRGEGADAAYLSLNRGEGGQNLIGNELGEALGLLRSGELLAARRLDGAQQFFTRAYDFGFSKNLDDTWAHWPQDSILKDVVRTIRRFRPQIVVSIFSGTPRDGHGQHQAAGWAAREAFHVAGDPARFPELDGEEGLGPWQPLKLYRSTRFDSAATTLSLDGGQLDAAVGKSFHQIAMAGRSLHRSQDMGRLQGPGPSQVRLQLWEDRTGQGSRGLFSGVDTTLGAVPAVVALRPENRRRVVEALGHYAARVDSARGLLAPIERARLRELLGRAGADLDLARRGVLEGQTVGATRRVQLDPMFPGDPFEGESGRFGRAVVHSLDVVVDGVSDVTRVTPGEQFGVTAALWNAGPAPVAAELCLGDDGVAWELAPDSSRRQAVERSRRGSCLKYDTDRDELGQPKHDTDSLPGGRLVSARVRGTVAETSDYSTPYFLRAPRSGDLYQWDPEERRSWGLPFGATGFSVAAVVPLGGLVGRESRPLSFRGNDQATGEFRLPIVVVPVVDVRLDPESTVWPVGQRGARRFTVTLTHGGTDTTAGKVALQLPAGWAEPPAQSFHFSKPAERASFTFEVRPPAGVRPGSIVVRALARDQHGRIFDVGVRGVVHPHIEPAYYALPSSARVSVADVTLPPLRRVGYLRGAADRVPEVLADLGVPLDLIDGATVERGDLRRYDAIVIGPRAYETDSTILEANDQLLRYARQGGLVIVQYQQYGFFSGGYAPYPMAVVGTAPGTTEHARVTDEHAAVRVFDAASPLLRSPNRIGPADWQGWVQERGLYIPRTWDRAYRPVLEMHDPGEAPLQGALLVARVGRGTWVYTGLSFFRQLPAGVPGAIRLFANLLAIRPRPAGAAAPADSFKVERE